MQLVLTWLAHEVSQLHLNVPLLLLQLLLLHPGRNHRSDELLPLHAPGLDPSHIVVKPHLRIADHVGTVSRDKSSSITSIRFPSTQTHHRTWVLISAQRPTSSYLRMLAVLPETSSSPLSSQQLGNHFFGLPCSLVLPCLLLTGGVHQQTGEFAVVLTCTSAPTPV